MGKDTSCCALWHLCLHLLLISRGRGGLHRTVLGVNRKPHIVPYLSQNRLLPLYMKQQALRSVGILSAVLG